MANLDKKQLRSEVIARRNAMPVETRISKSADICNRAFDLLAQKFHVEKAPSAAVPPSRKNALVVGVYSALGSEVELSVFEQLAWEEGWKLAYPCMVRDLGEDADHMEFYLVSQQTAQEKTAGFLARPAKAFPSDDEGLRGCSHILPVQLDALLVPMVAFTSGFLRMGYGGGNYDRYLPQLRSDCMLVGIAFEEQRDERIPVEPHDLALPVIVSA